MRTPSNSHDVKTVRLDNPWLVTIFVMWRPSDPHWQRDEISKGRVTMTWPHNIEKSECDTLELMGSRCHDPGVKIWLWFTSDHMWPKCRMKCATECYLVDVRNGCSKLSYNRMCDFIHNKINFTMPLSICILRN